MFERKGGIQDKAAGPSASVLSSRQETSGARRKRSAVLQSIIMIGGSAAGPPAVKLLAAPLGVAHPFERNLHEIRHAARSCTDGGESICGMQERVKRASQDSDANQVKTVAKPLIKQVSRAHNRVTRQQLPTLPGADLSKSPSEIAEDVRLLAAEGSSSSAGSRPGLGNSIHQADGPEPTLFCSQQAAERGRQIREASL